MVNLGNDWDDLLKDEFKKDYYLQLREFLKDAFTMFMSMLNMDNIGMITNKALYSIGIKPADFIVIAVGVLIMLIISIIQEKGVNIRESIAKKNIFFRWILYYGILLSILIFGIYGPGYVASNFIYGQF